MQKLKNEKELLQQVKKSDEGAFHTLFKHYHPFLFEHIYYQLQDNTIAQDILQESFLKIWTKRKYLKPDQSLYAFLSKISNNLIKDHYRKIKTRMKHHQYFHTFEKSQVEDPQVLMEKTELEDKIQYIVNKYIPGKTRTIFILSRIEGKSNDEISSLLNISKKTIENHLYYALKTLRKKISELT